MTPLGEQRRPPEGPSEIEEGRSLHGHELETWLLEHLAVGPGDVVLELAGGRGELATRVAARVRPGGTVICTDIRPARVAEAARTAEAAGAVEVRAEVMDMLAIRLPDESADAVVCRWGLMFPTPTGGALSEAFRVLRDGGRLALATWSSPDRNPWTSLVDTALSEAGMAPPDRTVPGQMLSLADPRRVERLLADAGFRPVALDEIPIAWSYADADAYWRVDVRWPAGPYDPLLAALPEAKVRAIRARVDELLEEYRTVGGGFSLPGRVLVAAAERPPGR